MAALTVTEPKVAERIVDLADDYAEAMVQATGMAEELTNSIAGAFLSFLSEVADVVAST